MESLLLVCLHLRSEKKKFFAGTLLPHSHVIMSRSHTSCVQSDVLGKGEKTKNLAEIFSKGQIVVILTVVVVLLVDGGLLSRQIKETVHHFQGIRISYLLIDKGTSLRLRLLLIISSLELQESVILLS